ncbi:MAG TPA: adenylate/guanylate cyclase domain-containing protein [Acidimicrobiales bacterium]
MLAPPPIEFAVRDGCHLAYQVAGAGAHEIVFVSGANSLTQAWQEATNSRGLRRMASFARIVTYDQRGMGYSDPVEQSAVPNMDDLVADLEAIIEAAGLTNPIVFGAHNGGAVAAAYAATHRVAQLILINTWARLSQAEDYPIGFDDYVLDRLEDRYRREWGLGRISNMYAQPRSDQAIDRMELAATSRNQAVVLFQMNRTYDIRHLLPAINVPTLVLHMEDNVSVPPEFGNYVASAIPRARFVLLPGSDQFFLRNESGRVIDQVELFITGCLTPYSDQMVTTMLFTDIVDSTPMAAALGNAEWSRLIDEHNDRMQELIKRFGGHEVKSTGDGFLAAFNDPAGAIRCALAACGSMEDLDFRLRAGVHVGEVSRMGKSDLSGVAVHLAQRLCGRASDGQVLVSAAVVEACTDEAFEFTDQGNAELKGIPGESRIYAVQAVTSASP